MGNGDILCVQDGVRMIEQTDCDGIMIGRGAVGNPWIFMIFSNILVDANILSTVH